MITGQRITYMCLAGFLWDAVVRGINPDGTVNIGSDVGTLALHELTRIEVCPASDLRPGTCCEGARGNERIRRDRRGAAAAQMELW